MTLKIAFAGTGLIAGVHAGAAKRLPAVKLEAVVNHRPESMAVFAAEFGIRRQYASVEDLLRDGDLDALVVCTPNYLHAPQSIAALESGVHVLVEKPMALNAVEARAMLEASQRSGAVLMVGHVWRFSPEVVWLHEQVAAGRLGDIVRTKGCCVHVNRGPAGWFTRKKLAGGGAVADMGIHAVDTVRFLLGDPRPASVYAQIGTHYNDFDVDDTGVITVTWDQGTTSYVEAGWWQPHADGSQAATQLYGTNGFGRLFPSYMEILSAGLSDMERIESGILPEEQRDKRDKFVPQMAHFAKCIQEGRQPNPSGVEGWNNMRVIDAAYESAQTGRVVML